MRCEAEKKFFSESTEWFYQIQYYEAFDSAVTCIKGRFDQQGYITYRNLEEVLVRSAAGKNYDVQLDEVYTETDVSKLKVQLANYHYTSQKNKSLSFEKCYLYLKSISPVRTFYSEVCTLARIIMVMPETNATNERSFSAMRRIKSYLKSTMGQS